MHCLLVYRSATLHLCPCLPAGLERQDRTVLSFGLPDLGIFLACLAFWTWSLDWSSVGLIFNLDWTGLDWTGWVVRTMIMGLL